MKKVIKAYLYVMLAMMIIVMVIMGAIVGGGVQPTNHNAPTRVRCTIGEINYEMWETTFARSGVFETYGDTFIELAGEFNIDPVLFATIAMHETGWGTSNAVINLNNPGGLMGSGGLMRFETLEDGMRVMARTINNHVNERGATTLEALRDIYAPLGADNDPTGLNHNWVPAVTSIANQFGGLTMNCDMFEGELGMPIDAPVIVTSPFGIRRNPTGSGYQMHVGIDFGQPTGSAIRASLDGEIVFVKYSNIGYGNQIIIQHDGEMWTQYAHLDEILVEVGDEVIEGELIGTMGSTGNSTGPHLHFGMKRSSITK